MTAKPPKPKRGLQFPGRGTASSPFDAAKSALAAANRVADAASAERVLAERDWRTGYSDHLVRNCELLAAPLEGQAAAVASAGLAALRSSFEYVAADGTAETLAQAMARAPGLVAGAGGFDMGVVTGVEAGTPPGPLRVPYGGRLLEGGALQAQLQQWFDRGLIEEDAHEAIGRLADRCVVDLAGRHFVSLGAGSEMCPTLTLLALGATVYAIDVPSPAVWKRLADAASASRGTMVAPLRRAGDEGNAGAAPRRRVLGEDLDLDAFCAAAGCNLLEETPEVAAWVCAQAPDERLCVGTYVYRDGANFVRVALAADAVVEEVCAARPDTALACLTSPTECYLVPQRAWDAAMARQKVPPAGVPHRIWYAALRAASRGRYCEPAVPAAAVEGAGGEKLLLRDQYVWMQGANYAFAKQVQRWRMLLARSRGHTTSANLGPMTLTRSILSNALIGAGVKGAVHFGLEPFRGPTSSTLLAALLVHDLTCEASAANPSVPLASPLLLFSENALHVGSWHAAFRTNSYTEVCALTYATGKAQPYVAGVVGAAGLAATWRCRRSRL